MGNSIKKVIQSKTFEDTRCLVFAISSHGGIWDDELEVSETTLSKGHT